MQKQRLSQRPKIEFILGGARAFPNRRKERCRRGCTISISICPVTYQSVSCWSRLWPDCQRTPQCPLSLWLKLILFSVYSLHKCLRAQHEDSGSTAHLYSMMKQFAVKQRAHASFIAVHDKTTIPIGKPNQPIYTKVRPHNRSLVASSQQVL